MARILIIDDEPNMRSMLRRMLHRAGHQVSEAGNGAEGIDSYERDPPDLVITDILMPKKEGIETIIALHRADPDLPIIAISGGGRSGGRDFLSSAEKLGACHTLPKPFRGDRLLSAVSECLSANSS
jgi:DNA-binding NtrC family response regulator